MFRRKTTHLVLFVFNESWYASSHTNYFSSQAFINVWSGARSLPEKNMFLSSAYKNKSAGEEISTR